MSNRKDRLVEAVHHDVILRLLSAERRAGAKSESAIKPGKSMDWCSPERIRALTDECLAVTREGYCEPFSIVVFEYVTKLIESKVSVEQVHELVFAPIARELGNRWLRDEISFVDVHLGVVQLQCIVEKIDAVDLSLKGAIQVNVAISAAPGDQHTFGASMAANSLNQRGWETTNLSGLDFEQWLSAVLSGRFNAVTVSLHSDAAFITLGDAIKQLKQRWPSKSALPVIVVAGDYFVRNPTHWEDTGADYFATTINDTVQFVENRLAEIKINKQTTSK